LLFSSNNSGGQFKIGERGSNLLVYAVYYQIKKLTVLTIFYIVFDKLIYLNIGGQMQVVITNFHQQ
ncbi:hypothetical protein, partial [Pedobacter petrophilus]|uniref:hypothetical protein n=1 Tax=Pedobacter petrophilus TaxID=1908241 RepID=UPI001AE0111B